MSRSADVVHSNSEAHDPDIRPVAQLNATKDPLTGSFRLMCR